MLTIGTSKRKIHFRLIYDLIGEHTDRLISVCPLKIGQISLNLLCNRLKENRFRRRAPILENINLNIFLEKTSRDTRSQYGPGTNRE